MLVDKALLVSCSSMVLQAGVRPLLVYDGIMRLDIERINGYLYVNVCGLMC